MSTPPPPPPPPPPGPHGSGPPPSFGGPGGSAAAPSGPAPAGTPPPAKGGGAGKVALVATALVVVIGGFSVIRLFGGGADATTPDPTPTAVASAEPTAGPTPGPTQAPTEGATPAPEATEGSVLPAANEQETPGSASVEGLVEAQVGEWRLVDAAELPEWIELGASSALRTQYKNPKNFNVRHIVAAFSSKADAAATVEAFADSLTQEQGTELLTEFPVVIDDEETGDGYFFSRNGGHVVLYSNGAIMSTIAATRRASVVDFYQNVPY